MIGNYKLQPNYGLDADSHKSTTTTISSTTSNSTMMNHHFNDYQENENASGKFEPDRSIIANIHNYSQPISKQHHHRAFRQEYSSENDDDEDDENAEEEEDEEIVVEQNDKQLIKPNINDTTSNQELDDNAPEHHTRRPMNAFLMFCKRHRSIVREKFPNLENRAITKILGDWWANIDEGEKVAYTNLAKEYKDAFFSAHPNFKWYKLPAPPLRTLSTRPGSFSRTSTSISEDDHDYGEPHTANYKCIEVKKEPNYKEVEEYEEGEETDSADYNEIEIKSDIDECTKLTNNNINSIENNLSLNEISIKNESEKNGIKENILIDCKKETPLPIATPVTLFKFADIQQMGGLNSLMQTDQQTRDGNSKGNNAAATQNEMGDSNEALTNYSEPFTNMRDHANKMQEDSIISKTNISNNLKRKINSATTSSPTSPPSSPYNINAMIYESIDSPTKQKRNIALLFNNNNNDLAVNNNNNNYNIGRETVKIEPVGKKSPRACKGQRYKEFMINSGKFPNNSNSQFNHMNLSGHNKKSTNKINKMGMNDAAAMFIRGDGAMPQFSHVVRDGMCDANSINNKHFATEEFDLEKRIKALPSLNLDSFMVRKRETKKKKKLSRRGKLTKSKQPKIIIIESEGRIPHYLNKVGSQKRKARKESITRLDVLIKNENHSNDQPFNTPSLIKSPGELSSCNKNNTIDPLVIVNSQPSSTAPSNLFILATLAEEEANKTKMQIT